MMPPVGWQALVRNGLFHPELLLLLLLLLLLQQNEKHCNNALIEWQGCIFYALNQIDK